ncbi:tetratricopeptide repeat protein [Nitrosovibrio tenuis]|uniref:tetratricopeptide repeat protein n=1 Tax=Nitrosovibrio tenuis TaxID=1233 RepID=UPI000A817593|nr:tetratricopeptide repeat protein [Nitrosovibrio tenuis]
MSVEAQRESLLNAPALMFMSAVLLIAFWVLFPRQPAFRDPSNLSAKDALSVAYLRVLVQSDPGNAPLRLSFVQLLTEAGMIDEAALAIAPLQRAPESSLTYEIRLADLKLSLQQLYRHPPGDVEAALRQHIAALVPPLLGIAGNDKELNQVVAYAEQFGEPSVLAETFEQLLVIRHENDEKKSRWLVFAAKQRMAAGQPELAARNLLRAFMLEHMPHKKTEIAKSCLHAYLQAGIDQEALKAAMRVQESVKGDAALSMLAADIAEPLADQEHALAWLEEASLLLPNDQALAERIVRLQISMGLLSESLPRIAQLRNHLVLGSDRHRLLAHVYDWNGQPDEALALWLSFARHKADHEAEARAFELSQAKADNKALVQLLEAIMARRILTTAEAEAYVKAGLRVAEPSHVEQQLRRHAEHFQNPATTLKALADVLVLQGKPRAALAVYQEMPGVESTRQRMDLARLYDEAGNAQKSFELLLQELDSPGQAHAEEYWLLLGRISTQLGQDAYASRAYEKALILRPNDVEIIENLQRLAVRHRDDKKSERLARYGWDHLRRIEDLQRLMRFSWKRQDWEELDHWLSLADEMQSAKPSALAQATDYWYFQSMRKMVNGQREAAHDALRQTLRLRGADPEITEAMIWLLLSDKKVDHGPLDALVQPFRNQSGSQSGVSPPLAEALAAAEQMLGKPTQAAAWYFRSLATRPRDFLWTLTLADNMEWAGCLGNANHARLSALKLFASHGSHQAEVMHPVRLAEYFSPSKDVPAQRGNGPGLKKSEKWQSMREHWGFTKTLDNASFFALQRQRERLSSPAWEKFADAVRRKDQQAVAAQLKIVSDHLQHRPDEPLPPDMLPLSLNDVDQANRWLPGESVPDRSDLNTEADICRQTLAKIRDLQRLPVAAGEQPAL